jgi:putative copper export protein
MTPADLDIAIRSTIVARGPQAIQVIARRTAPVPQNRVETAVGGVVIAVVMMRTMNIPDRLSWIAWSWGLCVFSLANASRNRYRLRSRARKRAERKLRPVVDAAA